MALTQRLAAFIVAFALPFTSYASTEQREKIKEAIDVVTESFSIPEEGIPPGMLKNAKAIAVIPGMVKVGFIIGGRFGSGVVMVRSEDGHWSNPAFVTLTGGSVGLQVGAQSTDVILIFKSDKSLESMKSGKHTLGADAGIAAGPVGRSAEAATDTEMESEIYSYSRSSGLFAGVSLQGASFQFDDDANAAFYEEGVEVDAILNNQATPSSEIVERLRSTLELGEAAKLEMAVKEAAAEKEKRAAPKAPESNPNPGKGILDI
ncbi:hypothetical protein BOW53_04915 [Solemya pervernicosa gill symbiont]|uniref:Ysc84 actin-binding domain-containing protein n=2 Tax=Gammaproteobacteria incertae sedis TaxID=118884 RepID=A0A1T2L7J0_9GAMM|nr:lipid-binding SYLF domain-containing protein [Candidatus Reidiella endopervernicosa]OOZ41077.1 hypothetical protein BOW53_04915 [Solemya pervernicosa gill symbiont]QKQ26238.1 lipid-binding SYLF domain-containing protein [Candidatus Reidiella endopervernicosa]